MVDLILNTFHHDAYKIESCSQRQNDRAHRVVRNCIKIFLGCYGPNVSKSDFNIIFNSKMYGKVWEQVCNWIFQDAATIRFKYDVQQSFRAR